jgi:hypothetical protein
VCCEWLVQLFNSGLFIVKRWTGYFSYMTQYASRHVESNNDWNIKPIWNLFIFHLLQLFHFQLPSNETFVSTATLWTLTIRPIGYQLSHTASRTGSHFVSAFLFALQCMVWGWGTSRMSELVNSPSNITS